MCPSAHSQPMANAQTGPLSGWFWVLGSFPHPYDTCHLHIGSGEKPILAFRVPDPKRVTEAQGVCVKGQEEGTQRAPRVQNHVESKNAPGLPRPFLGTLRVNKSFLTQP